jgi:hypothetical protein
MNFYAETNQKSGLQIVFFCLRIILSVGMKTESDVHAATVAPSTPSSINYPSTDADGTYSVS